MSLGAPCSSCKHALVVTEGPQAANGPPVVVLLCALEPPQIVAQWLVLNDGRGGEKVELAQAHLYPRPNVSIGCQHHEVGIKPVDAGTTVNGKRIVGKN